MTERTAPALFVKVAALAIVALAALLWVHAQPQQIEAGGGPGTNCDSYAGGVCEVEVGDIWFCDDFYSNAVCPTSIEPGETVRWNYPNAALLQHTTTECGDDCDDPTATPLWDSGVLNPGDTFEYTFNQAGTYLYYCELHPQQRGMIIVQGSVLAGDADCSGDVSAIDAALMLQLSAGLIDELPCPQNGDANFDGMTNAVDAALVLQFVAGLLPTLPPV